MRSSGRGMERHEAGVGPDRARFGAGGGHGASVGGDQHHASVDSDRMRYGAGGGQGGEGGGADRRHGVAHGGAGASSGVERHEAVSYERRDASTRLILWTGAGLTALVIAASVGMLWLFNAFAAREDRAQVAPAPVSRPAEQEPPEPRLQENPAADMAEVRAEEMRILNGYGWVDVERGIARIPIDRAIDRIVEHGLPERTKPPEPAQPERP